MTGAVNKVTGMTVILADWGQVFQEIDIDAGMTIATRPYEGDLWVGCEVVGDPQVGDLIDLKSQELGTVKLIWPIVAIRPLVPRIQFFTELGDEHVQ